MNYFDHYHLALDRWTTHIQACAEELKIEYDWQEIIWAQESFDECQQLRMLDDGSIKLKWEHRCWWADCKHPVFHGEYYCVLIPLENQKWEEPYDLAKRIRLEEE
jgi:hypothetical protein